MIGDRINITSSRLLKSFYFVGTCIPRRFLSFQLKTWNFEEQFVWLEADDQIGANVNDIKIFMGKKVIVEMSNKW